MTSIKEMRSILHQLSDKDLEEELKRREAKKSLPYSLPSEDLNISKIRNLAADYLQSIVKRGKPPKDSENYIFEEVMKTFYGDDIFNWINKFNINKY